MNHEISGRVRRLWREFAEIELEYDEVTDTDVRDAVHEVLTHYFVWASLDKGMPTTYRMCSAAGDRAVSGIVTQFLRDVVPLGAELQVDTGQARLCLLQQDDSANGGPDYLRFMGHRDSPLPNTRPAKDLFEEGDYD